MNKYLSLIGNLDVRIKYASRYNAHDVVIDVRYYTVCSGENQRKVILSRLCTFIVHILLISTQIVPFYTSYDEAFHYFLGPIQFI